MGFMENRKKHVDALAEQKRKGMFLPPKGVNTAEDLVEALAEVEHEKWKIWANNIMEREPISEETRARWLRFMVPYRDLPEEIKEYSLNNARKTLACFGNFFQNI